MIFLGRNIDSFKTLKFLKYFLIFARKKQFQIYV